jgi:hypothetical protein
MEKPKESHILRLDLTVMLTMVSCRKKAHSMFHTATQDFQDLTSKNLNIVQILMRE